MFRTFIIATCLLLSGFIVAQDDDEKNESKFCSDEIGKKAMNLYKKGTDKKKYKKQERMEFLMKALELEPEFAEACLVMGQELAIRAKLDGKAFTPTLPFFYKAISVCPKIHSEPYYYIGFDYYERGINDSAIKYLKLFLDFKDENDKKFARDWKEQTQIAGKMIWSAKKQSQLRKNVQFDPKVVRGASSERHEYLAYITPDDQSCYFVRRLPVKRMNQVYESDDEREVFMIATRDKTGNFSSGKPMDAPFNVTSDSQGGCSISIDNKHLYFSMMRQETGPQPNCDLYVSDFTDGDWGEIRKLSPNVNDPKYWDSQPSISADGVTLFFASDRPGGYGGIDLYLTKKDPKTGIWGRPQNLGPKINTAGDEKTPFIHSDSETLYFSSTGHFGFGKYDIYYVRKDEKGEWMEPENIGSPINDLSDDTGFFVSSDTKTGYFVSYLEGKVRGKGLGGYDLYSFDLYKEARPQKIAFVKGSIRDSAGAMVPGAIVEVKDALTHRISYATVDSSSGEYMLAVKQKNDVVVTVKKDNVAFNSKVISVKDLPEEISQAVVVNLEVKESRKGGSFVIDNILYNSNSAEVTLESKVIIENFAEYLKENPSIQVEIQGHTDNIGNAADNLALSSNRAHSVKALIEENGIDGKRVYAKGYGATKPIANNDYEAGRAQNRRTEFLILEK